MPHSEPPNLGATPLEIILKSLTTGLTNDHVKLGNPFAYTFSNALVRDLREIFLQQKADGLFLCEMGSQNPNDSIDELFKKRMQATLSGTYKTHPQSKDVSFVDKTETLKQYLQDTMKAADLEHLEVHSLPPYADIGNPQKLSVSPPEYFNPLPSNIEHRGVAAYK